ncbi:endonuclease/exonuclease/phosphatase family protein [Streptomyces millisiae]|uniref:Endonuclease/exonuclease/phosphatase family protein n=1 Tax=Streptomyces millisiae TaxID=3075542 RepID=A0ABU2LWB2_9ACTN|nr:endonuclease/exonuclease/phosphatase family protein [Streptomyces sp. DSM 44918]MDT0321872.1 endonuclease/exonuclease/phosphatase family protein [Streptomyces sp. DSM 44918]
MAKSMVYNILNGGRESSGSRRRWNMQMNIVQGVRPDVLCVCEATWWHWDDRRILRDTMARLEMECALMVPSRVGDGVNCTALLYRPATVKAKNSRQLAAGVFHHAAIESAMDIDGVEVTVLGTHLSYIPARRDEEVVPLADRGADMRPEWTEKNRRVVLMGDMNCAHPNSPQPIWRRIPAPLYPRYRTRQPDGSFGDADRSTITTLLAAGYSDPYSVLGRDREHTTGHWYENEPEPQELDHILVSSNIEHAVTNVRTVNSPEARAASDHLPRVCELDLAALS